MNFNEYQQAARKTVIRKGGIPQSMHWALGLCGEASECQNSTVDTLAEKLGDLMWYVANMVTDFGEEYEGAPWILSEVANDGLLNSTHYRTGLSDLTEFTAEIAECVKKLTFYSHLGDEQIRAHVDRVHTLLAEIIIVIRYHLSLSDDRPSLAVILEDNISKLEARHGG